MNVRPGVFSYDLAWKHDEPLGVHVIEADGATVLFGGATLESAGELVDVASRHDVDVVLVEHGDWDHYEGVPSVRDAVGVEVAVPSGDSRVLEEAEIAVDHELVGGRTYWGIEVIPAPGHTPGNASYRYSDVLVAGDTVVGADSKFAADGEWSGALAPIAPDYNDDDERARASVPTLLEHRYEVVLVSHGGNVLSDGYAQVETLVEDLE